MMHLPMNDHLDVLQHSVGGAHGQYFQIFTSDADGVGDGDVLLVDRQATHVLPGVLNLGSYSTSVQDRTLCT